MMIRGLGVDLNHCICTNDGKRALHSILRQKMKSTQLVAGFSFVDAIYLNCI